jgi:hypothetical protein
MFHRPKGDVPMRIAAALVLALLALPAFAQDDRPKRLEEGRTLVELTTAESVIGPMLDAMWPGIEAQLPGTLSLGVANELKATFATEIKNALSDVFEEIAALYADHFTLAELTAINKFYASAPGAKLIDSQGTLMQQMLPSITARLEETLPGAMQRVMEQASESGTPAN